MVNSINFPAPPPPKPNLSGHTPLPPPPTAPKIAQPSTVTYHLPPGQPSIGKLVAEAFDAGYSDVHVGVGETPRFRNRGEIETTTYPETDLPTFMSWLYEVLSDEDIRTFQANLDFDGATSTNLRGYGSMYLTRSMAMRW